jgi:hypothetical protein
MFWISLSLTLPPFLLFCIARIDWSNLVWFWLRALLGRPLRCFSFKPSIPSFFLLWPSKVSYTKFKKKHYNKKCIIVIFFTNTTMPKRIQLPDDFYKHDFKQLATIAKHPRTRIRFIGLFDKEYYNLLVACFKYL